MNRQNIRPQDAPIAAVRGLLVVISLVILSGCATQDSAPAPIKPELVPARIMQLLPPTLPDRAGWSADVYAAFSTQGITPSFENLCAVLAVTEQESSYRADPSVPGLPEIAWREIDNRAERAGIPKFAVRAALQLSSPDGRAYNERIDAVKTERELSEIYEDFIGGVPMGMRLFARHNPVRTGGPMQVSVSFAETHASAHPYPFPIGGSIRREVFTRRGGMYFGIAHLLGYEAPYAEPLYRFADFNAGRYSSRNAAFQSVLSRLSGNALVLDGDLLPPGAQDGGAPGETERAALSISQRLNLSQSSIRRDLERGDEAAFERTRLYERVFEQADQGAGRRVPRAVVPTITLKSPKFTRKLTTEWFARRVDERYRRCLAKAAASSSG
ncbi:MAG: DUF1615 domain-containing protein [Burkholderiaceae bacterium]